MKYFKRSLVFLFCILAFSACSTPSQVEKFSVTGLFFDTVIQIDIWETESSMIETYLDECLEICQKYENKFSNTIEMSEISQINHANGQPVTVSDETIELLQKGIEYGELTNGKFDITISSVSDLWCFTDNPNKEIPSETVITEALTHVNYKNIQINGNTVTLLDPDTKIDLGGIAKGYIADKLKEHLIESGVEHALINLGGNSLAVGSKYDGSAFRIGIQEPFAEQGTAITALEIKDQSVVSSGIYERYFEKDNLIYHHILDTNTGYPVRNNLLQVTIVSDRSVDGDALSTSCYVLGFEEGSELIKALDGIEAYFITDDYEIHHIK